jgi:thiamine kinase-like enzyme
MEIDLYFRALSQGLSARGITCLESVPITGGSNNRIHRINVEDGSPLIAKQYFSDDWNRLDREWKILEILGQAEFEEVPRPVARFDELNTAVYTFHNGQHVEAEHFTDWHLNRVAAFLSRLHGVTRNLSWEQLPPASKSAFSLVEAVALIHDRIMRFLKNTAHEIHPRVQRILEETGALSKVETALASFTEQVDAQMLERRLPIAEARLSPADFGPHNMLWQADGSLVVLDFEYGGYDHPARLLAELSAHDQMSTLSSAKKEYLLDVYQRLTPVKSEILEELPAYRELAHIEWTVIYLQSLLPKKLARLAHAKGRAEDFDEYIDLQSRKLHERLALI